MKIFFLSAAAVLALGALSATAQITWSLPINITGPTDVLQTGTFVGSASANNAHADYIVGTMTFHYGGDAYVSLPNIGGSDGSPSPTPSATSTDAANYNLALEGCGYVNAPAETANIVLGSASHPLIIGQLYNVEIWDSAGGAGRTTTFTDTTYSTTPTLTDSVTLDPTIGGQAFPQFAIGTFTAQSTTETITFSSTPGTINQSYGEVNDVLLIAAPEPSTYAMLLVGALLLGFCVPRRLLSN